MSRRTSNLDPTRPGHKRVPVVCSGRGTHTPFKFFHVYVWPTLDGTDWNVETNPHLWHGEEWDDLEEGWMERAQAANRPPNRVPKTYRLQCRRCGRDQQLRQHNLERAILELSRVGVFKFDISHLG